MQVIDVTKYRELTEQQRNIAVSVARRLRWMKREEAIVLNCICSDDAEDAIYTFTIYNGLYFVTSVAGGDYLSVQGSTILIVNRLMDELTAVSDAIPECDHDDPEYNYNIDGLYCKVCQRAV